MGAADHGHNVCSIEAKRTARAARFHKARSAKAGSP
jgi:hypothetical protein